MASYTIADSTDHLLMQSDEWFSRGYDLHISYDLETTTGRDGKEREEFKGVCFGFDTHHSIAKVAGPSRQCKRVHGLKSFMAALTTQANLDHKRMNSYARDKGCSATVTVGGRDGRPLYQVEASVFSDNLPSVKIEADRHLNYARKVAQSDIWASVRHVEQDSVSQLKQLEGEKMAGRRRLRASLSQWEGINGKNPKIRHQVEEAFETDSTELVLSLDESLPPLDELKNLTKLTVIPTDSGRGLVSLESLTHIPNLNVLNLSGNPLLILPRDFGVKLPKLEYLNVDDTLLTSVPVDIQIPCWLTISAEGSDFLTQEAIDILTEKSGKSHCEHSWPQNDHLGGTTQRIENELPRSVSSNDNQLSTCTSIETTHTYAGSDNVKTVQDVAKSRHVPDETFDKIASELALYKSTDLSLDSEIWMKPNRPNRNTSFEENVAFYYKLLGRNVPKGLIEQLNKPYEGTTAFIRDSLSCNGTPESMLADLAANLNNGASGESPTVDRLDALRSELHTFIENLEGNKTPEREKKLARSVVTILDTAAKNDKFRQRLLTNAGQSLSMRQIDGSKLVRNYALLWFTMMEGEARLLEAADADPIDPENIRLLFREVAIMQLALNRALHEGDRQLNVPPPEEWIEGELDLRTVRRNDDAIKYYMINPGDEGEERCEAKQEKKVS